ARDGHDDDQRSDPEDHAEDRDAGEDAEEIHHRADDEADDPDGEREDRKRRRLVRRHHEDRRDHRHADERHEKSEDEAVRRTPAVEITPADQRFVGHGAQRGCRKVGPPDIEGGRQAGAWRGLGVCAASAAWGAGEIAAYSGAGFDAPAPPPPDAPTAPQPDAPSGPPQPGPLLGSFQLTYYYVAAEADYANTGVAT